MKESNIKYENSILIIVCYYIKITYGSKYILRIIIEISFRDQGPIVANCKTTGSDVSFIFTYKMYKIVIRNQLKPLF